MSDDKKNPTLPEGITPLLETENLSVYEVGGGGGGSLFDLLASALGQPTNPLMALLEMLVPQTNPMGEIVGQIMALMFPPDFRCLSLPYSLQEEMLRSRIIEELEKVRLEEEAKEETDKLKSVQEVLEQVAKELQPWAHEQIRNFTYQCNCGKPDCEAPAVIAKLINECTCVHHTEPQ